MKGKILRIAMVILPLFGFSQIGGSIVYDPTQAANMSTQISNTATQINQLEKSLEYMEKASATLEKVNSYVRDVEEIKNILSLHKQSLSGAKKVKIYLNHLDDPKYQKVILDITSESLKNINSSVSIINKLISSNYFKMTDKERMDLIERERSRVYINYLKIRKYANRVK